VKRKEVRLYGYGHASYKTIDPRVAPVLELLKELGTDSIPFYDVAEAIHTATEHDEYFVKRELFPNVDHYSQLFYPTL
jgi:citrate synthase